VVVAHDRCRVGEDRRALEQVGTDAAVRIEIVVEAVNALLLLERQRPDIVHQRGDEDALDLVVVEAGRAGHAPGHVTGAQLVRADVWRGEIHRVRDRQQQIAEVDREVLVHGGFLCSRRSVGAVSLARHNQSVSCTPRPRLVTLWS
jgi:hypothetical protein